MWSASTDTNQHVYLLWGQTKIKRSEQIVATYLIYARMPTAFNSVVDRAASFNVLAAHDVNIQQVYSIQKYPYMTSDM